MADRFGKDIKLDSLGDVVFTPDGDVETVFGGALVAQDIRTEAILSPGSCFWAPDFGQGLIDALKGLEKVDVEGLLRAAAFNDERVDFESVRTSRLPNKRYSLTFSLIGELESTELYFDLKDRFDDLG